MTANLIVPCIWFDDRAEEAAALYTRVFPDSRVLYTANYPENMDNPSEKPRGSTMLVEVDLGGFRFTLLNGGPIFKPSPSISFMVTVPTANEADRIFAALAEGGKALMPIDTYPWSERYGWVQDRFGASWQIMTNTAAPVAIITPCIMFCAQAQGKARAAMEHYLDIFPDAEIGDLSLYPDDADGGRAGQVQYGSILMGTQMLVCMDSGVDQAFTFDEGVSLQIMCQDQAEVDRYWDRFTQDGEESWCGWLKDRYGVSWQIAPESVTELFKSGDPEGIERAFKAMLTMHKLDIATLQAAYEGKTATV